MDAGIWLDPSCATGTNAIKVTTNGSGTITIGLISEEWAGLAATAGALVDQSATPLRQTTANTTWSVGATGTTSQAGELVVAVAAGFNNSSTSWTIGTPGAPWTEATPVVGIGSSAFYQNLAAGHQVTGSTGTFTYNGTNVYKVTACILTLNPGAAAAPLPAVPQPGGKWWRKKHRKNQQQLTPVANPLMQTLTDAFPGSSVDSTKWNSSPGAGTITVSGGILSLSVPTNAGTNTHINSLGLYSLRNSYAYAELNSAGVAEPNTQVMLNVLDQSFTNGFFLYVLNGNLHGSYTNNGITFTDAFTAFTYSATSHKWLRIRETAGTVFWETAPDGLTWTVQGSLASSTFTFNLGAMQVLLVQQQNTSTDPGTTSQWSNFNTTPSFSTWNGAFTTAVTAQDSFAGTKTAFGVLTYTVTAQDSFAGKKTGFAALVATITAAMTAAGKKTGFGNLAAAVTALMSAAGTKTAKGVLTATVTAQAAFTGTKTAFGHLTATVTAAMSAAGTKTAKGALTTNATAQAAFAGTRVKFGQLTAAVTAALTAAGTKTAFGAMSAAATAQAAFAGTKTAFGQLVAAVTAFLFPAATPPPAAPFTPLQPGSRQWRTRYRRKQRIAPPPPYTYSGAFSASATAQATFATNRTQNGTLTAAITAVMSAAGTKSAFGTLVAAVTAAMSAAGKKTGFGNLTATVTAAMTAAGKKTGFGNLTAAITAAMSVAGTKTAKGVLTATVTAQAAFAGTKTAFGHLTATVTATLTAAGKKTGFGVLSAAATAQATFNGIRTAKAFATFSATARALFNAINNSIRNPMNYGGNIIRTVFGTTASEVANLYGGTLAEGNYGGGLVSANTGGTATLSANTLGGTISPPALGGTLTSTAFGGGAVGWTMQEVDQNFPEFNDLTLNVALTSNGSALNLTGYTVKMLMKPNAGVLDSDGRNIILSSGGGSPAITITNAAGGLCNIAIANADVQDQTHTFYRIDAVDGSGHINTCIFGTITYTPL
jgi:hypothetical protein